MTNSSPKQMLRLFLLAPYKLISITAIALCISSCDGGLFGTGDGTDTIDVTTAPTSDAPGAGGGEGVNPPAGSPAPDASGDDQSPTIGFENLLPSGLDGIAPFLNVINASSAIVTVTTNTQGTTDSSTLASGETSAPITLSLMDNIVVLSGAQMEILGTISPLTVASSTLTTIVVRDPLPQASNNESALLITQTRARSSSPGLSQIRIIQAVALDTANQSATLTLSPDADNPGSSELLFNPVDALINPITPYQLISPGQYVIQDSLNRFAPFRLSIAPDEVYTLLISDTAEPVARLILDSNITQNP